MEESVDLDDILSEVARQLGLGDRVTFGAPTPAGAKDSNFIGVVRRVELEGGASVPEGQRLSVVVKSEPASETRRNMFRTGEFFDRELLVYREVLPALGVTDFVPRLYTSATDRSGCRVLVLEDMSASGYSARSKSHPLDPHHCALTVRQLARFHARSFNLRVSDPGKLEGLAQCVAEVQFFPTGVRDDDVFKDWSMAVEEALATLSEADDGRYRTRLRRFCDNIVDEMADAVNGEAAEPYAVVCHGDTWTSNMLYRDDEDSGLPESVCLLDWQIARYSSPITDLLMFLYLSTDQSVRATHWDQLTGAYLREVASELSALGCPDPDTVFPEAEFQKQLLRFGKFGLGICVLILGFILDSPADLDSVSEFADFGKGKPVRSETYRTRMREVILDAVDRNFI